MGRLRLAAGAAALLLAACTAGEPASPAPEPKAPATTQAGDPAWRALAAAPSERTEVAAAAVGRRIWVLGGYAPDGATLATVEVYDTAADTWARGPDLPVAVNHAMAATLDGVLYVAGGNDGDGPAPSWPAWTPNAGAPWRRCPRPARPAALSPWTDGCTWSAGSSTAGWPATPRCTTRPPTAGAPRPGCPPRASTWAPRPAAARCTWSGAGPAASAATWPRPRPSTRHRPLERAGRAAHGQGRPGRHRHRRRAGGGRRRRGRGHLPGGRGPRHRQRPLALLRPCPPPATASGWSPSATSSTSWPAAPSPVCTPPPPTRPST